MTDLADYPTAQELADKIGVPLDRRRGNDTAPDALRSPQGGVALIQSVSRRLSVQHAA